MALAPQRIETIAARVAARVRNLIGQYAQDAINEALEAAIYESVRAVDDADVQAILQRARELAGLMRPRRAAAVGRTLDPRPPLPDRISAPFRFVKLNETVVPAEEAVRAAAYDIPLRDGYSGEIDLTLAFEPPMLIGGPECKDAKGRPIVLPLQVGGKYVIPGASVRGFLRAAMEIVCQSRLAQLNKHHRYGVRDFDHPLFAEDAHGQRRLGWDHLHAGWLRLAGAKGDPVKKEGDSDYVVTPCEKRVIRIRALPRRLNDDNDTNNGGWHLKWLRTRLAQRYAMANSKSIGSHGETIFEFDPAHAKLYVATGDGAKQTDPMRDDYVVEGAGVGAQEGWLVFSDWLGTLSRLTVDEKQDTIRKLNAQDAAALGAPGQYKKREYVFLDGPKTNPVRLKQDVCDRFELINSKPAKAARNPDGSWAVMKPTLDAKKRIPIFFVGDLAKQDEKFDSGLTRLFKIAHEYSVDEVLARDTAHTLKPGEPDMVSALFGCVIEEDEFPSGAEPGAMDLQRKGRVAAGFFTLDAATPGKLSGAANGVAMGPRASFAPFYLAGRIKDWSDGNAHLAGRKRYFPRFPGDKLATAKETIIGTICNRTGGQQEQATRQKFLVPASEQQLAFNGKLRLHNVTKAEIGAILWTLTHGGDPAKPYRHMLGRAKTAGAGQMRVKSLRLRLKPHLPGDAQEDPPKAWELPANDYEGWLAPGSLSMAPFLSAFDAYMQKETRADWPKVDDIAEFLGASDPRRGADLVAANLAKYHALGEFKPIRAAVKANAKVVDPAPSIPQRLLAAPRIDFAALKLPYRI